MEEDLHFDQSGAAYIKECQRFCLTASNVHHDRLKAETVESHQTPKSRYSSAPLTFKTSAFDQVWYSILTFLPMDPYQSSTYLVRSPDAVPIDPSMNVPFIQELYIQSYVYTATLMLIGYDSG